MHTNIWRAVPRWRRGETMSYVKIQDLVNHRITRHSHVLSLTSFGTGTPGLKGIDVSKAALFVSLRYSRPEQGLSQFSTVDQLDDQLKKIGLTFDVVFVDPFHTFQDSTSLLKVALKYARPSTLLFVHDCMPFGASLSQEMVTPKWAGVTYAAFRQCVDSLHRDWFVVDSDFGIGVIGPMVPDGSVRTSIPGEESTRSWSLEELSAAFTAAPRKLMRAISPLDAGAALEKINSCQDLSDLIQQHVRNAGNAIGEFVVPQPGSRVLRFARRKFRELRTLLSF
jgi:hypothetical protein